MRCIDEGSVGSVWAIKGVRDVREAANEQNLQAFVESITVLENGLHNLKNMYEKELDHAR